MEFLFNSTTEFDDIINTIDDSIAAQRKMHSYFNRLDRIERHLKTRGIDRVLYATQYGDGFLENVVGITFPSMESIKTVGDPNHPKVIVALEGIKNIAKATWGWIKKTVAHVTGFINKTWARCGSVFGDYEKKIALIRETVQRRKNKDASDIDPDEFEIPKNFPTYENKVKSIWDELKNFLSKDAMSQSESEIASKKINDNTEIIDKFDFSETVNVKITNPRAMILDYCVDAQKVIERIKGFKEIRQRFENQAKALDKMAKEGEAKISAKENSLPKNPNNPTPTTTNGNTSDPSMIRNALLVVTQTNTLIARILKFFNYEIKTKIKIIYLILKAGTVKV